MVNVRELLIAILQMSFIIFISSCDDINTCGELYSDRKLKIAFAQKSKSLIIDSIPSGLSFYSLLNGDTSYIFYDDTVSARLTFPLSQLSDTSEFVLKINKLTDTLLFIASRKIELISSDCGFNTKFTLQKLYYTNNTTIDTMILIESDVNKDVDKNFKLVLKQKGTIPDTINPDAIGKNVLVFD